MSFTLYNLETGIRKNFSSDSVMFGRKDLEGEVTATSETVPLERKQALEYVSTEHFKILRMRSGQYVIVNYSKNGTCLNGEKISVSDVRHGDLIRMGPIDMDIAPAVYFLVPEQAEEFIDKLNKDKEDRKEENK